MQDSKIKEFICDNCNAQCCTMPYLSIDLPNGWLFDSKKYIVLCPKCRIMKEIKEDLKRNNHEK